MCDCESHGFNRYLLLLGVAVHEVFKPRERSGGPQSLPFWMFWSVHCLSGHGPTQVWGPPLIATVLNCHIRLQRQDKDWQQGKNMVFVLIL